MDGIFYNLNGITSKKPITSKFWVLEWNDQFSLKENDITFDLDMDFVKLTYLVAKKIFGSTEKYHQLLLTTSTLYPYAGIDAEIKISKVEFEKISQKEKSIDNNKLLYYYDFLNIISSLQNLIQESKYIFCEFYKTLNVNTFMTTQNPLSPNGLMFAGYFGVMVPPVSVEWCHFERYCNYS
ncbi:hypothetical protein [Maribacter arenosus]|uniref:Uncharacterized protein n=1 Tax=Maribacter arenosus TaxID=1854708 RepID=A0ABR7VDY5_9FLAO|nr:hypothetical protein [Maribacter arenosus]MBD0851860.1 hypothetical protein [Maribacter arenosus]